MSATETYAYPNDLARFARERWEKYPEGVEGAVLETLLSTCYQAGLLCCARRSGR